MIEYICKFCGKTCKNKRSLSLHERLCNENTDRKESNVEKWNSVRKESGIRGENQYTLAKRLGLDKPVMSEESRKKLSLSKIGRKHTEETKLKIQATQKKNYEGKSRWYTQTQHRLSYAEQYFIPIFSDAKMHYHVNRFFLDFAWPEKKLYIEIDGEQHRRDEKVIAHDKERTNILNSLGWSLIERVYWPDFSKLSGDEKRKYVDILLSKINSAGSSAGRTHV